MSALFVTGVGTDIGKTFVTAGLVRHLRANGVAARALKPVMSGYDPAAAATSDAGLLLTAMGAPTTEAAIDAIAPWRFRAPLSPDMAARHENRALDFETLAGFCAREIATADFPVIIEGAGGVMSPLGPRETCLDLIDRLRCPALLISGSYLGAISHTLTAATALASRGLTLGALVINETPESQVPLEETVATLRGFLPHATILTMTRAFTNVDAFEAIALSCALYDRQLARHRP